MSDNKYTFNDVGDTLVSAPANIINANIPSCKIIGGTDSQNYAFQPCKDTLESFTFQDPTSLIEIKNYAFYQCKKLKEVNLQLCTNLKTIGGYAFSRCETIESINFPENLQSIGTSCFEYCGVVNLNIPLSLTSFGITCFQYCTKLESITFQPDSEILTLPHGFAIYCSKLKNFTIPKNAQFDGNVLGYCTSLLNCYIENNESPYYCEENGVIYSKNKTSLILYPMGKTEFNIISGLSTLDRNSICGSLLTSINIPEGVKYIHSYCLARSQIASVSFPSSLLAIYESAFLECRNLVSIVIPDLVTTIGSSAFQGCSKLNSITLPAGLKSLGGGAFNGCDNPTFTLGNNSNLIINDRLMITDQGQTSISMYLGSNETVNIPASVEIIKASSFSDNSNLKHIVFDTPSSLKEIESKAFLRSSLETIEFPVTLKTLRANSFQECRSLANIVFPNVTLIENSAFYQCTNLQSIEFRNTEEITIQNSAFYECSSLTSITLPSQNINYLSSKIFEKCTSLRSLEFPQSLDYIESYAFQLCRSLETVDLSQTSVSYIGTRAFDSCYNLRSFTLPEECTSLGEFAFSSTAITTINLTPNIITLNSSCFYNCTQLETFVIPENSSLEIFDSGIFSKCSQFEKIECNSDNFKLYNEALYSSDMKQFIIIPPSSSIKYLAFPEQLEEIRPNAILDNTNIHTIKFSQKNRIICL